MTERLTEAEVRTIQEDARWKHYPHSRVIIALCKALLEAWDQQRWLANKADENQDEELKALKALSNTENQRDAALEREQVLRGKWLKLSRAYPECFVCPECGPLVRADEDGCCATCGSDTTIRPTRAALGAKETP